MKFFNLFQFGKLLRQDFKVIRQAIGNLTPKQKTLLFLGVTPLGYLYYLYDKRYRQSEHTKPRKALESKMRRKFLKKILGEFQLSISDKSFINMQEQIQNDILALFFPVNIAEIQKIIKLCEKNKICIKLTNKKKIEQIEQDSHGVSYVALNFKNFNKMVFDENTQTFTVGSGVTLRDLNEFAKKYGYYFPYRNIEDSDDLMLIEAINNDTLSYNHKNYLSMKNFIMSLVMVLANTSCIKTSINIPKSGPGININELFVGQRGNIGLIAEACLKLPKLPLMIYNYKIDLSKGYSLEKNIELVNQLKDEFEDSNVISMDLISTHHNQKGYLIIKSNDSMLFSKLKGKIYFENIEEYYDKNQIQRIDSNTNINNKFIIHYDDINNSNIIQENESLNTNKSRELLLRAPLSQLISLLHETNKYFTEENYIKSYSINFDLLKGDILIKFNHIDDIQHEQLQIFEKKLINSILYKDGIFIWHKNKKDNFEYKKDTIRQEFGKNHLLLSDSIKHYLDPKHLFIVDEEFRYHYDAPQTSALDMIRLAFKKLLDTEMANQMILIKDKVEGNINQLMENYKSKESPQVSQNINYLANDCNDNARNGKINCQQFVY